MLTIENANLIFGERGAIPDIGQISGDVLKGLKAAVKAGRLVTYRGHWNTLSAVHGIGPLKTIYATPGFASVRAKMDAGLVASCKAAA